MTLHEVQLLIFFICNVKLSEQSAERGNLNTLCPQLKTLSIKRRDEYFFSVLFVQAVLEHLSFCLEYETVMTLALSLTSTR